jgi:NAD(P)-dependent dehydrogenase (short-subunit alcohol dehydrogenase family)
LEGSNITSNVIHPGLVQTNIARSAPIVLRKAFEWFGGAISKTLQEGAAKPFKSFAKDYWSVASNIGLN